MEWKIDLKVVVFFFFLFHLRTFSEYSPQATFHTLLINWEHMRSNQYLFQHSACVVWWTHSRGLRGGSGGAVLFAVHSCAHWAPTKDVINLRETKKGHFLTVWLDNHSAATKNSTHVSNLTGWTGVALCLFWWIYLVEVKAPINDIMTELHFKTDFIIRNCCSMWKCICALPDWEMSQHGVCTEVSLSLSLYIYIYI